MCPRASAVAASRRSMPAIAARRTAASLTVRAMGPAVSWLCAIGMMPARLTRPIVGLMPTMPLTLAGQTTEPSVSVPTATAARLADTATPLPELDPHGFLSSAYGFLTWPARALQPLDERADRKLAHSLRLAL